MGVRGRLGDDKAADERFFRTHRTWEPGMLPVPQATRRPHRELKHNDFTQEGCCSPRYLGSLALNKSAKGSNNERKRNTGKHCNLGRFADDARSRIYSRAWQPKKVTKPVRRPCRRVPARDPAAAKVALRETRDTADKCA